MLRNTIVEWFENTHKYARLNEMKRKINSGSFKIF